MNCKVQKLSDDIVSEANNSDYSNLSSWMQQALDNLNGYSTVNSINNSLHGRSRYATVEDAVKDMRERTGLDKYLTQKSSQDRTADGKLTRSAAFSIIAEINLPESITNSPKAESIISFVKNRIDSSNGNVKVPELQHELFSTFDSISAGDVEDESVVRWLSDMIANVKSDNKYDSDSNNSLIGKLDLTESPQENELFQSLNSK
jgi:hypothetical protein